MIDLADARHLVTRTGMGAEWRLIKHLEGRSRQQAIDLVLNRPMASPVAAPRMLSWNVRMNMYQSRNPAHKMKAHSMMMMESSRLKQWWINHLLKTQSPFLEKMTLFWHGHFPSSLDKVEQTSLLYRQNITLRRHAMGNFAALLKDMAKDPAMSVYLDGKDNIKTNPNENFARELLELFTLGHGHYSEHDVQQVAKAFTGWSVNRFTESFVFNKEDHNPETKTVLGKRVSNGDDVIRVLLEHPRTAMTIAEKFWNQFVSDSRPDPRVVNQWAKVFRNAQYDIKILLKTVLSSDQFWSEKYRGTLTKSPVDLVIGSLRAMPSNLYTANDVEGILRLLGQDLFDPANVKGWKKGMEWIDAETIMVRASMVNKLTGGNMNAKVNKGQQYPDASPEELQQWLLAGKPVKPLPETPGKVRLVRALALDPMYQLI